MNFEADHGMFSPAYLMALSRRGRAIDLNAPPRLEIRHSLLSAFGIAAIICALRYAGGKTP